MLETLLLVGTLAAPQGRLRPPDFVTCDRNRLTSFTGPVKALGRRKDATTLEMETDEETRESFRIAHPGADVRGFFFLLGRPFAEADWITILANGRVRSGVRATVWVCETEPNPRVDWRPSGTSPSRP